MSSARRDVSDWVHVRPEPRGATAKEWIREPARSAAPENDWLFKAVVHHRNGSRQAGDWSEFTAASVAHRLGIPAATTLLAVRDGVEGVIVQNVKPQEYDMESGRLAMFDVLGVETTDSRRDKTASIGHSLENVMTTLDGYLPPPAASGWSGCTARDVMVGYLILDSFIGNTDRHEQNWAILRSRQLNLRPDCLASTFDLGASLGFQLTDEQRSQRLGDADAMETFAARGLARRFHGDRSTPLVDLAIRAASYCSGPGRARVDELVNAIAHLDVEAIVSADVGMSEVGRNFAREVLRINGRRLRDASWS